MRVVAAPDKFRGTASAAAAARAVARAVAEAGGSVVEVPMADGGEGTLEALGGPNRTARVSGPLGRPVEAALSCVCRLIVWDFALSLAF